MTTATRGDIDELLGSYAAAWAANDPARINRHWDDTAETHFYKAEEVDDFFTSMPAIREYWEHNERFHEAVSLELSNVHNLPLADGVTLVIIRMRWDIRFAKDATNPDGTGFLSAGKAMGGDNHVLAVVRDTPDGPRFIGWSETPDAPVKYVWRMCEDAARI